MPDSSRCHEYVAARLHRVSETSRGALTSYSCTENIAQLCKRKKSATWGPDGWKSACFSYSSHQEARAHSTNSAEVVVSIISDGRKAIHPRVLDWCVVHRSTEQEPRTDNGTSRSLSALGVYQPNVMTNQIDEQPVACHLFENTVQMSIAPDLTFRGLEKGIMPCQIMCVYEPPQTCALY